MERVWKITENISKSKKKKKKKKKIGEDGDVKHISLVICLNIKKYAAWNLFMIKSDYGSW